MRNLIILITGIMFLVSSLSYSQNIKNYSSVEKKEVPGYLIKELNKARKQENEKEVRRLENIINGYYNKENKNNLSSEFSPAPSPPIFGNNWLPNDIIVFNDTLSNGEYNTDLKKGKDGYLYAAFIGKPQAGFKGAIYVYKSSNGGLNWTYVNGIQSSINYFGQLSLLANRNGATSDSVRIMVYYSASATLIMNDAFIGCVSFRRDGQGGYNNDVASPNPGYKYLYPSACDDGAYNNSYTYMHVIFVKHYNSGFSTDTLCHCRSTDWGKTHTFSKFYGGVEARYPSAAMKAYYGSEDDTIYIADCNTDLLSASFVRIIKTTGTPSSVWTSIASYPNGLGAMALRPKLTIVQQNVPTEQKKMFLTFLHPITDTGSGKGSYAYSLGGTSWSAEQNFSNSNLKFANCASDTNTSVADYILVAYSNNAGDSLMVKRGSYILLGSPVKVNSSPVSLYNFPAPAIYNAGTTKYSSMLYAGTNNYKLYFDGEHLTIGIRNISGYIPDKFSLEQNYPNPFNSMTKIKFEIPDDQVGQTFLSVSLKIYNVLGKEISTLVNEPLQPGTYQVNFDAGNLQSGIYFYKLTSDNFTDTKKLILLK